MKQISESVSGTAPSSENSSDSGPKPTVKPVHSVAYEESVKGIKKARSCLYGRDKEQKILSQCLSRVNEARRQGNTRAEFILISGYDGTGKSALAFSVEPKVIETGGLFLSGKFDLSSSNLPFSAVMSVLSQFCWKVKSSLAAGSECLVNFEDILQNISKNLDIAELSLLMKVVSDLESIVREMPKLQAPDQGHRNAKDLPLATLQKLFRAMNEVVTPLVIVLDDLQWADTSSLELIHALVTDRKMDGLVLLGSYRSNDVGQTHVLSKVLRLIQADMKDIETSSFTELQIENLDLSTVTSIIENSLSMHQENKYERLAKLCMRRTQGNIFFLLAFIEMLIDEKLIYFNKETTCWDWDISMIDQETAAIFNVVDLLQQKMKKMADPNAIELLELAACLGNAFRKDTLYLVWTNYEQNSSNDREYFELIMGTIMKDNFLEPILNGTSCRFLHDKIQEAALTLSTNEDFKKLQYKVGMLLFDNLDEKGLEDNIFIVTNLQNNSSELSSSRIANLNLLTAIKSQHMCSFGSAANYISTGIQFLPKLSWITHPKLTLDIYSLGAKIECALGNFKKAEKYCHQVLKQKKIKLIDKARVYLVQMDMHSGQGRHQEALNVALDVLKGFGFTVPKNEYLMKIRVILALYKMKKTPNKQEIESLQLASDNEMIACMEFMTFAMKYSHLQGNKLLLILITSELLKLILQHGLSDSSLPAFVGAGIIQYARGDFSSMRIYDEIALSLLDKVPTKRTEPQTLFIAHNMGLVWAMPLQLIRHKFLECYKIGMQIGNSEWAMIGIAHYIGLGFWAGTSLCSLEQDYSIYFPQMVALKRHDVKIGTLSCWQTVHNLMGLSENTIDLTGTVMDEEELLRNPANYNALSLGIFRVMRVAICTYFSEFTIGAERAIEVGRNTFLQTFTASALGMFETFVHCICFYATARITKKGRYVRLAKKGHGKIRSWVKKGNVNSLHHLKLLNAELSFLKGRKETAFDFYHQAIIEAAQSEFVPDAALASERFAVSLLECTKGSTGDEDARSHMEQAIKYYSSWGAKKKVEVLKKDYCSLLNPNVAG
mmetsp:Transcript_8011/g.11582  ORF Transcript_8011/g.11582 Transcript_8011/m.11582 type:complete len:1061 (-) Transcript_8011:32-3214(-)